MKTLEKLAILAGALAIGATFGLGIRSEINSVRIDPANKMYHNGAVLAMLEHKYFRPLLIDRDGDGSPDVKVNIIFATGKALPLQYKPTQEEVERFKKALASYKSLKFR